MSTDTAILVSDTILNYGYTLEQIPKKYSPEYKKSESESVQLEGFIYVTDELDIASRKLTKKENPDVIMSEKIKKELIFKDFDLENYF